MKILIAGDGKVGMSLTRKLSSEGHDLTLIDKDGNVIESIVEHYDVMAVQGNCASVDVLKHAGVMKADLLIAATSADEINLLCCMTAHGLNPNLHTIARIRNPEYDQQVYAMRELFALSMAFNPDKQAAQECERLLKYPGFLKRDTFAKGRVEIVELRVLPDSKLKDVALNDLGDVVKCQILVCAVSRDGEAVIPGGDFVLKEGDRIYVTATSHNLTELLANLGIITHRAKKIIMCGGGHISYYLAERLLKSGIKITMIENNKERCEELATLLPSVDVVYGDGSNQELLESVGIDSCDALLTMMGFDEMNMIISLYGQRCKVPQIITKVDHTENRTIQDSLSLGSVICAKELSCDIIVRYVRAMQNKTGAALSIHGIADGQIEALEFKIDSKVSHCKEPLKKLKIKKNVLVACITHHSKTELAYGDSTFEQGDTVVVVTNQGTVLRQFNDIFES